MEPKHTTNYGTTYLAILFIIAVFFELYWIMTDPYNYFMLIGTGIIVIITGYLTFDSIEKKKRDDAKRLAEESELMIKAQKAIYLATKKNTKEAEKNHMQNLKAIELMMNNLINAQKDMTSLMITKNEEISSKQVESKPQSSGDMSSLIEQLSASNAKLAKEVQSAITVNELIKANADLVKNVREVLSSTTTSASQIGDITDYVSAAVPEVKVAPVAPASTPTPAATMEVPVERAPVVEITPANVAEDISQITNTPIDDSVSTYENTATIDLDSMVVDTPDSTDDSDDFDFETFELPEDTLDDNDSSGDTSDVSIDADAASTEDIVNEINLDKMDEMIEAEGNTIAPEISDDLDEEMSTTPVAPPFDGKPNKQLTEEEIAALFARL
ncbi:MAG: hypothetical protein GX225_01180 [Clostridiales bacterium]|nr:hypothetical protein [Clostridiales bacterium]